MWEERSSPSHILTGNVNSVLIIHLQRNLIIACTLHYLYATTVRVENFEDGKFRAIRDFALYLENFAGINSTFHVYQPPTKNAKLKTPRNFLPVRYIIMLNLLVDANGVMVLYLTPFLLGPCMSSATSLGTTECTWETKNSILSATLFSLQC